MLILTICYLNCKYSLTIKRVFGYHDHDQLSRYRDICSYARHHRSIFRSFYLHTRALVMLYYSLVYPYMQYCILVWGSTYPSNLTRIVLLQKRLIRIIYKASYDAHTQPFFKELGILPFDKSISFI